MPRIYNATFQPFTYEELATPLIQSTQAHQKVEEDYNNNMLVVDSLRLRAMNEPDAKWAKQITDYANQLEGYAMDLARNGLTRETRGNLLNMKRGYGTTVSPVLMAMLREKELQSIRDKNPDIRNVFSATPSIDQIIANPNIGQNWYNGSEIFNEAQALADAASKRNVDSRVPENISNIFYRYGKTTGFTNEEIADIEKNPVLGPILQRVYQKYGWNRDFDEGSRESNQLKNEAITGMMAGVSYNEDWHYGQRPDYHDSKYWLEYEKLNRELHPERYPQYNTQGNGSANWDGTKTMYVPTYSRREREEKTNTINNLIKNKNIVVGQQPDLENGGVRYLISDQYIQDIFDGLNGKHKTSTRLIGSSITGYVQTSTSNPNDLWKTIAGMYGITKNDSPESAKAKVNDYLNGNSYYDLADATQRMSMFIPIDKTKKDDVLPKYTNHTAWEQDWDEKNHRWMNTKKEIDLDDVDIEGIWMSDSGPIMQVTDPKANKTYLVNYPDMVKQYANEATNYYKQYSSGQNKKFNSDLNNEFASIKKNGFELFDEGILESIGTSRYNLKTLFANDNISSGDKENILKGYYATEIQYYQAVKLMYRNSGILDKEAMNALDLKIDEANREYLKYSTVNNNIENANINTLNYLFNAATFSNTSKDQLIP